MSGHNYHPHCGCHDCGLIEEAREREADFEAAFPAIEPPMSLEAAAERDAKAAIDNHRFVMDAFASILGRAA